MPLPTPNKKESPGDFIGRFMTDEGVQSEHTDKAQRMAVAYKQLKNCNCNGNGLMNCEHAEHGQKFGKLYEKHLPNRAPESHKDSKYMNPDGTFKGGFHGCVLHMTEVEGHSEESASKICGTIAETKNRSGQLIPIIGNRDSAGRFHIPTDGWVNLAVKGEFFHPGSGLMQVLDEASIEAMVNRFSEESKQPKFAGLRIDYDHFSYDNDKSSIAGGWIMELQNRADGLWARVKWTAKGEEDVAGGNFRFLSPVWKPGDLEQLGNKRVRPLRLDSAGLTNDPNLKGLTPLSNRAAESDTQNKEKTMDYKLALANLLGVAASASDVDLEAAVALGNKRMQDGKELANRMSLIALSIGLKQEAETTEIANRGKEIVTENTKMKAEREELLAAQVERDLVDYKDVIADPAVLKANLMANRGETIKMLKAMKPAASKANQPLHNRNTAKNPDPINEDDENSPENKKGKVLAAKIGNRASQLAKEGMRYEKAFQMARQEVERDEVLRNA